MDKAIGPATRFECSACTLVTKILIIDWAGGNITNSYIALLLWDSRVMYALAFEAEMQTIVALDHRRSTNRQIPFSRRLSRILHIINRFADMSVGAVYTYNIPITSACLQVLHRCAPFIGKLGP